MSSCSNTEEEQQQKAREGFKKLSAATEARYKLETLAFLHNGLARDQCGAALR